MKMKKICLAVLAACAALGVEAKIELAPMFTKGMVLAKNRPIRVFGTGEGAVTVKLRNAEAKAEARDGKWLVELSAMRAGGPFVMEVSSADGVQKIEDVRIGTVLLLAGQSNMAFTLKESTTPEKERTGDALMRMFSLPRVSKRPAKYSYRDGWIACTDEDAGIWSAIGYHVAKELRARSGEAVGVINCYQGASTIQSWLPTEIADAPKYRLPDDELYSDHFNPDYASFNVHGILYKTTFSALAPYAVSSVIWYQGESNTGKGEPKIYAQLVAELVNRWRADLREPDLPFVVVQIADTRQSDGWKGIQAAQLKVPDLVENVKTVRCGDVCEARGIHPPTKSFLGRRIAQTLLGQDLAAPLAERRFAERPEEKRFDDMRAGFPKIVKNGAVSPNGETSPFVWKGRLMRMEKVDPTGGWNTKDPAIRAVIRDVETGRVVDEKGVANDGYYHALYCEDGRAYVTCVQRGEKGYTSGTILVYESDDLVHWTRRVLFEDKRFRFYNTSIGKGPDGYVLVLETDNGSAELKKTTFFTAIFATSKDMKKWQLMDLAKAYPQDRYCGGPWIKYHNGWWYLGLVTKCPCVRYTTYLFRTRDFASWEVGKYNPMLVCSAEDQTIAPNAADISPELAAKIPHGFICSASDMEMCEFKGRTYITYIIGNQLGYGYLCDAWYDRPMGEFLENFFK